MAQVIPYTDTNAHGQLNQSICFRRKFGKVFLGNTSRPANPRTQKQVDQRALFTTASKQFPYLNYETKQFYIKRAAMLATDAKSLFMRNSLNNILPENTPGLPIKSIDELTIMTPAGTVPTNFVIEIESVYIDLQSIGCTFWNKQGSNKQIERSEIGPDGILSNPVIYSPGKFDDGIDDVGPSNIITFPGAIPNPALFVADFWWQPHFSNLWGPVYKSVFTAKMAYGWAVLICTPDNWSYGPRKLGMSILDMRTPRVFCNYLFNPPTFPANSLHYIAISCDLSKGADEKIELFFDNNLLTLYNALHDKRPILPAMDLALTSYVGATDAIMDNLKLYADPGFFDIITGNKNNEDFYTNPLAGITYASIQDTNKIFTQGDTETVARVQRIKISETAGVGAKIPFYYTVLVTWRDLEDNVSHGIMRLPEIDLPGGNIRYLYIASDWSLYWDKKFTRLAGAY